MDLLLLQPLQSSALFLLLLRRKHLAASIIIGTVQVDPILYNEVFGISKTFRNVNFALAAVVVCFGFGVFLQEFLLCRPFAKYWNPLLPGVCGSQSATILAEAIINMLLDIAIFSLPMPLVWRLQMTPRRKIRVTIIVGLGFMYVLVLLVSSS